MNSLDRSGLTLSCSRWWTDAKRALWWIVFNVLPIAWRWFAPNTNGLWAYLRLSREWCEYDDRESSLLCGWVEVCSRSTQEPFHLLQIRVWFLGSSRHHIYGFTEQENKNIQLNHFGRHSRLSFFCSSDEVLWSSTHVEPVSLLELSASVLNPDFHCIKEQHEDSSEFLRLSNNIMTDCSCLDEPCLSESTFASVIHRGMNSTVWMRRIWSEWRVLTFDPGLTQWHVRVIWRKNELCRHTHTHTHTPSVFSQVARWTPEIHKLSRKSLVSPFDARLGFLLFPACVSLSLMMYPVSALYLSICVPTLSLSVEFNTRVHWLQINLPSLRSALTVWIGMSQHTA